jgi:hypothetical protein
MLVVGPADLVDLGSRVLVVGPADLVDVGSRVSAWRRLENGTLDLVLVGVPRVVTGSLLPIGLEEGSPETTGIPLGWRRVAPRLPASRRSGAEEAAESNPSGGWRRGPTETRRELREEAWISH